MPRRSRQPDGGIMALQDLAGRFSAVEPAVPSASAAKPARRLPVSKDWPAWAIVGTQVGILVAVVGLWELGAQVGVIDAFFWSQPSAIARTLVIFFTAGDAWTDIGFTFQSTIYGFM